MGGWMSPPMSEADQFNADDQDGYLSVFKHMLNTCTCLLYHIIAELLLKRTTQAFAVQLFSAQCIH